MIEITSTELAIFIISVVFCSGGFYYGIKAEIKRLREELISLKTQMAKDISRVENKQDKYNHLQERVLTLEIKEAAREERK